MTSDVFGERRLESLDGLGYDLKRGSNGFISSRILFSTSTVGHPRCTNFDVVVSRAFNSLGCGTTRRSQTGAFSIEGIIVMSVLSLGVNMGFTEPLVLLS